MPENDKNTTWQKTTSQNAKKVIRILVYNGTTQSRGTKRTSKPAAICNSYVIARSQHAIVLAKACNPYRRVRRRRQQKLKLPANRVPPPNPAATCTTSARGNRPAHSSRAARGKTSAALRLGSLNVQHFTLEWTQTNYE